LRRARELAPGRADAAVGLARLLVARGEREEALALVEPIAGNFQAEGLAARIRLEERGDPDLSAAWIALDAGDPAAGVDALLDALPSAGEARDDVRRAIVAVLDELGVEDPVARDARRRMAAALF
jgi:putative thioredoxin